jgi:DNA polymerase III sliding clamp (beta) subunit (PCNA family)
MKKSTLTQDKAKNSPAGGVVVGKRNGQTMVYDDASVGGYFVGKTHKEGGIQMINKSTGQPLEVQGSEIIITAPAVADQTKREFEGKMMTNREILSNINEKGGGVAFADGGDVPKSIKHTGASYKYGGKTMTDHEIMMKINGGHLAEGYSLREIASIHQVPLSTLKNQVRLGMIAENEHTPSKREQMKIVKDHLFENPKYYTLLKKVGLKDGGDLISVNVVESKNQKNSFGNNLPLGDKRFDIKSNNKIVGNIVVGSRWYNEKSTKPDYYEVVKSFVKDQNKGIGTKAYIKLIAILDKPLHSDMVRTPQAESVWKKLEKLNLAKKSKDDIGYESFANGGQTESLVKDAKSGNTPARDLNNYNDVMDLEADGMVGAETSLYADGGMFNTEPFLNYYFDEIAEFLKYQNNITLNKDFTFKYKGELFRVEPIVLSEKNIKEAYFSIIDSDDEEVGDIVFNPNNNKKFEANSDFFDWNNIKFYDGGDVKPYDANSEGDSADIMFADGGAVNPIITNWNDVPSIWKNTSKVKKVAFTNSPYDKGLYSIVAPFLGKDDLRPIMSGINFDENGITVTNAHVLITLPYPSKEFEGVYEADLSKRASSDQITIEGNYPNYSPVIPKKEVTKAFFIDVYKLLQYNDVAMKFANKITNAVNYKIEDEVAGFNAKFLNESLKTLLKLGHDKAYAHYIAPNKALLLSPSEDYEIGNDELVLTMPVMVQNQSYGAEDMDYGSNRKLSVYYDFNDNEIHNADGSIAEFKMTYENNSVMTKEDVTLLEKLANGKNRLPILDYVLIENGIARASDLDSEYYLKNVDLPNGIYKPNKGALEITMEAMDDFPTSPIFVTDEDTIQFVISSGIFEYYIDKLKYVVGQDDLRPVMQGICLHHTSDNKLFLAGTDAHILLRVNITEYVDMPEIYKDMKFIIQPKRLYDFLNSTENTALTIKSNVVATSIQSDNWSFYARNIDGNYPNYDAVMPKETTKLAVVNLEPIKKALNSEMVKNYVKEAYSKDKVFIFNKQDEIFIATGTSADNIQKICDTNVDYSLKDYYNNSQSVLLFMPYGYDKQTNFAFRKDLVDRVAKIVNHNKLELHYTELNRPYLIPIDSFEFKTTTKEYKVREQKPSVAEIKLVSSINEVNEIKEAIETLEMLSETATRKDKKEINEAVEVLQMLLDTYEY